MWECEFYLFNSPNWRWAAHLCLVYCACLNCWKNVKLCISNQSLREKDIHLLANLLYIYKTDDVTKLIQYENMSAAHSSSFTVNREVNLMKTQFSVLSSDEEQLSLQTFTIAADKAMLSLDCWGITLLSSDLLIFLITGNQDKLSYCRIFS